MNVLETFRIIFGHISVLFGFRLNFGFVSFTIGGMFIGMVLISASATLLGILFKKD